MVITLKIEDRVMGEIKKNRGDKVPIETLHSITPPNSSNPPTLAPYLAFIKGGGGGGSFNFSKIDTNGEGLKIFSRK